MDARLLTIHGHRPVFLRRLDLPAVADAIVGYYLGRVRVFRVYQAQIGAVLMQGPGVDLLIRSEDWQKITPFLVDGTFAPQNSAVINSFFQEPSVQQGGIQVTLNIGQTSTFDPPSDTPPQQADPSLYGRVLSTLQTIFTGDFPTSPL